MTNTSTNVRMIAELGVALALALILNMFKLFQMPYGGSVSLEMLPIVIMAFRWGIKSGILAGAGYGLLRLATGATAIHWVQYLLDYPVAFASLGLAGIFASWVNKSDNKVPPIVYGILVGTLARFVAHFTSGLVFFGEYAPEGQSEFMYSLIYNTTFLAPEGLITMIAVSLLALNKSSSEFFTTSTYS
ncbi:energy-coupled thiamine transporter ThiT [Natranaerobius trueperi]|uniref:Energy-coupled thiamine transporter ThiT n=1 Tax=Natranaerobius trueperi TaxID=759412 RepID=A0A226BZS5_9FIRM|nr:energy-coupled thiamine transporter ThiT [Natranaerobius trueperi]OWZ84431.1 energy-coupled thiamine transporter ThiT [Natranaerobius trueperi]